MPRDVILTFSKGLDGEDFYLLYDKATQGVTDEEDRSPDVLGNPLDGVAKLERGTHDCSRSIVYDSLEKVPRNIFYITDRCIRANQRRVVPIDRDSSVRNVTWKKVAKPHSLNGPFCIGRIGPGAVSMSIEAMDSNDTST